METEKRIRDLELADASRKAEIEGIKEDIKEYIQADIKKIEEKIEQMFDYFKNRLPTWATFLISLLMAIIGYLTAMLKVG